MPEEVSYDYPHYEDNHEAIIGCAIEEVLEKEYSNLNPFQYQLMKEVFISNKSFRQVSIESNANNNPYLSANSVRTSVCRSICGYTWVPKQNAGNNTSLSDIDSNILLYILDDAESAGYPIQGKDVRELAKNLYYNRIEIAKYVISLSQNATTKQAISKYIEELNEPSFDHSWLKKFLKTFDLKLRTPETIEVERARNATTTTIRRWFDQYGAIIESFPPEAVFNMDEMMIELHGKYKVVVKSRTEGILKNNSYIPSHTTCCCCCNAIGEKMPIFSLMSGITRPTSELSEFIRTKKIIISSSMSGWMTRDLFYEWCTHFISWHHKLYGNQKGLLLLDSHNSRENIDALKLLKENNITVLTFPPHLTHIMQPFDVSLAKSFKANIKKLFQLNLAAIIGPKRKPSQQDYRFILALTIEAAWNSTISYASCITAFGKAGICPFEPNKAVNSIYAKNIDVDPEMEDFKTSQRLHTTSRILTSDQYLSELYERNVKKMKILNHRQITCYQLYNYRLIPQVASFDYNIINSIESLKLSEVLLNLENSLDNQVLPILEPSFAVLGLSIAANIEKVQSERIRSFVSKSREEYLGQTYDERIRNFIVIFNKIINKKVSLKALEYFEDQVSQLKKSLDEQYDEILRKLSEVASVQIENDIQALFILGLIKSNKLGEYRDMHPNGLPEDPVKEYLENDQIDILGQMIDDIRRDLNSILSSDDDSEPKRTLDDDIEDFRSQLSEENA